MQLFKTILFISAYLFVLSACTKKEETKPELKKHYDKYQVEGSFILYDLKKGKYLFYNVERAKDRFSPAATYQIFNALVALDTGIVKDENHLLKWAGIPYDYQPWNVDQDLKTAMQHSTAWYHQELINRAGVHRIQRYLDLAAYGNKNISSGLETFWSQGSLQISSLEQLDFLKKLYNNDLPFSIDSLKKVKEMLVLEKTSRYKLSGKTGWSLQDGKNIGWFIGSLEQNNTTYLFVNNIQATNPDLKHFIFARQAITKEILKEISLL